MNDTSVIRNLAAFLFLIITFTGCDTVDPHTEAPQAPAVIPEQAFALNLGVLEQDSSARAINAGKNGDAFTNWLSATIRAGVAVHITHAILEVPFELTKAIQQVPPVYNEHAFIWAADTLIDGQRHSIALKAQQANNYVDWQMKVSGVIDETGLSFDDFLLYNARTYTDAHEGTFQIYFPVTSGTQQVMDGSYEVIDESRHTLTFSIPQGVEDIGGSSAVFDKDGAWITLDLTGPLGGTHLIEWNTETGEGSLTAQDYNNGEKACWDTALQNSPCPVGS